MYPTEIGASLCAVRGDFTLTAVSTLACLPLPGPGRRRQCRGSERGHYGEPGKRWHAAASTTARSGGGSDLQPNSELKTKTICEATRFRTLGCDRDPPSSSSSSGHPAPDVDEMEIPIPPTPGRPCSSPNPSFHLPLRRGKQKQGPAARDPASSRAAGCPSDGIAVTSG
jgi:hypothetical protein